ADRPGGDDWGIWDDLEREHDGSVAPFRPSTLQEFDQVCRLEMVLEVLDDATLFVFEVLLAARHVALLGEDEEVDIFVRFGERAEESRGVPELYVFIDHSVDDEQATLQLLDVVEHGAIVIALRVRLGRTHIALRVRRVVAVPIGGWRPRHTDLEYVGCPHHGHTGHVAAVTPAEDTGSSSIGVGQSGEILDAGDLVIHLHRAHAVRESGFEGEAAVEPTAIVELEDDEALLREVLRSQIHGQAPIVGDALDVRATVDRNDHRVASSRLEGRWPVDCAVQRRAVGCGERHEVGRTQAESLGGGFRLLEERCPLAASDSAQRYARALFDGAVAIEKLVAALRDNDSVDAVAVGELRDIAAIQRDNVQVALEDRRPGRGEVHEAAGFVHRVDAHDHPIAGRELTQFVAVGIVHVEMAKAGLFATPQQFAGFEEADITREVN